MFKLIVVCAFFAVAAATPVADPEPNPDVYQIAVPHSSIPLGWAGYTGSVDTILTHQSPLVYSHLIKKRSPQLPWTYLAPNAYWASNPLATTYSSPLIHGGAVYNTAHLIKKRSATLLPYSFASPYITTYAASSPLIASRHFVGSVPLAYAPLIKK